MVHFIIARLNVYKRILSKILKIDWEMKYENFLILGIKSNTNLKIIENIFLKVNMCCLLCEM